jgi:uncharacterized protein YndB with AHSA1/START domain
MKSDDVLRIDPALDLVLERTVDVPVDAVWRAWTEPKLLMQWFTPAPWKTVGCEIDLRPGGMFRTVMRSPEGQEFPSDGCYLQVVPNKRLVWTSALLPGFRPIAPPSTHGQEGDGFLFTGVIDLTPEGTGTRYRATAIHSTPADKNKHEQMGFQDGWGAALKQLVELMKQQ